MVLPPFLVDHRQIHQGMIGYHQSEMEKNGIQKSGEMKSSIEEGVHHTHDMSKVPVQ
jgi:hypothetical protein